MELYKDPRNCNKNGEIIFGDWAIVASVILGSIVACSTAVGYSLTLGYVKALGGNPEDAPTLAFSISTVVGVISLAFGFLNLLAFARIRQTDNKKRTYKFQA